MKDLRFDTVSDPRVATRVKLPLPTLLASLLASMVTRARSLRMVEQRTAQMTKKVGRWVGRTGRIADNTFGKVLPRLSIKDLVACLQRLIKAEHRRGNLTPTRLPWGTIAIDGKNAGTLHWPDLCRVLGLESATASFEEAKKRMAKLSPQAQMCQPKHGTPYALMRMHTVTLVSSTAAPCVHLRPIPGHTNENGAMPDLIDELKAAYGHTRLFELVTSDAGNTNINAAKRIIEAGWHYFGQLKSTQGDLYTEALRVLAGRREADAQATYGDYQNGKPVTYHVWCHDLSQHGWLDWTHARQMVRVQRTVEDPTTGEQTVGNRYYITSKSAQTMTPRQALDVSRAHWRCENETHWTADVEMQEDRRKLAWSRHPIGILVVTVLRMMALCILAVARHLSRMGHSQETPSWAQVAEHFLLQLCGSILDTKAFDTA